MKGYKVYGDREVFSIYHNSNFDHFAGKSLVRFMNLKMYYHVIFSFSVTKL